MAALGSPESDKHPSTPDGRYFVVRGRLWRKANPKLSEDERQRHVNALMDARRMLLGHVAPEIRTAARLLVDAAKCALGVWAAEGFQNDLPNFVLSDSRRSDFLEGTKGSRTPEIMTFCGVGLLPPRLLGERGPVWWDDGSPDYNRKLLRRTPYAEWYRALALAAQPPAPLSATPEPPSPT